MSELERMPIGAASPLEVHLQEVLSARRVFVRYTRILWVKADDMLYFKYPDNLGSSNNEVVLQSTSL